MICTFTSSYTPPQTIKSQNIKADKVYLFRTRKGKDSALVAIQFFDSLGHLVERDNYDLKGEVIKITNYIYVDSVLMRQESISKNNYTVQGSNLSKEVKTYDYDTLGNVIAEKDYSFSGESFKNVSVTTWNREYDSARHLIKEYYTPPKGTSFLYHIYFYSGEMLKEVQSNDYNEHWIYSDQYELNKESNVKSVYLQNTSRTLREELFYDNRNNLVTDKIYGIIPIYSDHITRTYTYNAANLVERQSDQDMRGENYFYRHVYSTFQTCDPIFTKVENLPSLKVSNEAFGDTLTAALKSKNFPLNDKEVTLKFVLTDKSKIDDLAVETGNVVNEATLKETISQLANSWSPATQNGQPVCALVRLHLRFIDNKVSIQITQ